MLENVTLCSQSAHYCCKSLSIKDLFVMTVPYHGAVVVEADITGANECNTDRPPFKDPSKAGEGECDAYKVEVTCLQNASCGGDAACQAIVDARIVFARQQGNANKAGCFP